MTRVPGNPVPLYDNFNMIWRVDCLWRAGISQDRGLNSVIS